MIYARTVVVFFMEWAWASRSTRSPRVVGHQRGSRAERHWSATMRKPVSTTGLRLRSVHGQPDCGTSLLVARKRCRHGGGTQQITRRDRPAIRQARARPLASLQPSWRIILEARNGRKNGQFWLSPGRWPRDTADFVFLARAVDHIGKSCSRMFWVPVNRALSSDRGPELGRDQRPLSASATLGKAVAEEIDNRFPVNLPAGVLLSALLHPPIQGAHGPLRCQTKLGVKVLLLLGG